MTQMVAYDHGWFIKLLTNKVIKSELNSWYLVDNYFCHGKQQLVIAQLLTLRILTYMEIKPCKRKQEEIHNRQEEKHRTQRIDKTL